MTGGIKNISGKQIASARKKNKPRVTQQELSNALINLGVPLDRAAVAKIEIGLRGVLDYELLAISRVLDVSLDWLLAGDLAEPQGEIAPPPRPAAEEETATEPPARDDDRALVFL